MKRIIILGLSMLMIITLVACSDKGSETPDSTIDGQNVEDSTESEEPEDISNENSENDVSIEKSDEYVELKEIPVIEDYNINNLQDDGASFEEFRQVGENIVYAYYTNIYDFSSGNDVRILMERIAHLVSDDVFFNGLAEWEAWENGGDDVTLLSLSLIRPGDYVVDGDYEEAMIFGVKYKLSINGVEEVREERVHLFKEWNNIFLDRIE